eukprot:GHVS01074589.1.p1 GENE.GHVS01074589.1~~GHVS01074589.1.p1  ORF type:complete len:321 (-),score=54.53 GHVS01074589.1:435-1397(-)
MISQLLLPMPTPPTTNSESLTPIYHRSPSYNSVVPSSPSFHNLFPSSSNCCPSPPPSRVYVPLSLLSFYLQTLHTNPLLTKCITAAIVNGCSDLLTQTIRRSSTTCNVTRHDSKQHTNQTNTTTGANNNNKHNYSEQLVPTTTPNHHLPSSNSNANVVATSPPPTSYTGVVKLLPPLRWSSCARQALIGFIMRAPLAHTWFGFVELLFKKWDSTKPSTVAVKVALDQALYGPLVTLLNFIVVGIAEGRSISSICRTDLRAEKFFRVIKKNAFVWTIVGMYQYRYVPNHLRVVVANIVSLFWMAYIISVMSKTAAAASTGD